VAGALAAASALAAAEKPVFRHVIDDAPLDVRLQPGEPATEAVKRFHETGENAYVGDPAAIAEGKQHYETWCQSCHLPDGSGRIGPSLVDDQYGYPRTRTDVGMFEIIFGGGAGAMQPFKDRLTQDQILKLIAYLRTLRDR
jgi:cytochrome c-L